MTAAVITALCTGVAGVIGAIFNGIARIRHQNDTNAHGGKGHP